MKLEAIPLALKPIYRTPVPDAAVPLYRGKIEAGIDGQAFRGTGTVSLEWLPKLGVRWRLKDSAPPLPISLSFPEVSLKFPTIPNALIARVTSSHWSAGLDSKPPSAEGYIANGEGIKCERGLQRITFHLANFVPFSGKPVRDESNRRWRGRASATAEGWRVTLDSINYDDSSGDESRTDAGFSISHVCQIEREDGAEFTPLDAKSLLESLYWFFSFCRGKACAPILPVGFDSDGRQCWSELANWNVARQSSTRNWYNDFSEAGIELALPGFLKRDQDSRRSDSLRLAIYWYLEAGRVGNDTSIVVAQAALELVAWTVLVLDKKALSRTKFKQLKASDQIRELLKSVRVPIDVPDSLTRLSHLASERRWQDGPQTLAGIRNLMVHSGGKSVDTQPTAEAYFEASMLSLWYVELVILSLIEYGGDYSSRLVLSGWKGQEVMQVPWRS